MIPAPRATGARQALSSCGLAILFVLGTTGCDRAADPADLRPLPRPDLAGLPSSVREQLGAQRERVDSLLAGRGPSQRELGEAFGMMGKLYLAYGLTVPAEPALENASDLLPDDPRWPYYLGYLHKSVGGLAQAATQFERALDRRSDDVASRIHLAEIYMQLGREHDAEDLLTDALALDSTSAAAHFLLGQLAGSEDPARAARHYEAILRLQPEASAVRYPLGLAYRELGDLERSRSHLSRRGDVEIAVRDPLLAELQRIKVGPEIDLLRADRFMKQGRSEDAVAALERAIAADPDNPVAHLNLGVVHARRGEMDAAERAFQAAIELDPSDTRAHYNLGRLLGMRGDLERAGEEFRAAIEADPTNQRARSALAMLLLSRGRCGEAISHFDTYLVARPANAEARVGRAMCHAQLGAYAEARRGLEAGLAADSHQPELLDALIRILSASPDPSARDGERALELARQLTERVRRPETLESLAMAYAEVGRFSEAVRIQRQVIGAAESAGATAALERLRAVLDRYEAGSPSRTPWPALRSNDEDG